MNRIFESANSKGQKFELQRATHLYKTTDLQFKYVLNALKYTTPDYTVLIYPNHIAPCLGASLLKKYQELDPRLKPMTTFILHWAKIRGILDPSKGYLSSYALELMIVFFLQLQKECVFPSIQKYAENNLEPIMIAIPTLEGIKNESAVKTIEINYSFNNLDVGKIKKDLKLPINTESVAFLITRFFCYFSIDYPV